MWVRWDLTMFQHFFKAGGESQVFRKYFWGALEAMS